MICYQVLNKPCGEILAISRSVAKRLITISILRNKSLNVPWSGIASSLVDRLNVSRTIRISHVYVSDAARNVVSISLEQDDCMNVAVGQIYATADALRSCAHHDLLYSVHSLHGRIDIFARAIIIYRNKVFGSMAVVSFLPS